MKNIKSLRDYAIVNTKTVVEQIFENWESMSRIEFDEYMLNNRKTLLREENEQIDDAISLHKFKNSAYNYLNNRK